MSVTDELKAAGVPISVPETQSQAFIAALKELGYHFRLNLCDDSVEINPYGQKLSDIVAARIRVQMRDRGVKNLAAVEDAYIAEAERKFRWPLGRRPDEHPGLSELGL